MARLLVQLKLRLLTNALRSSSRAKASFMISTAFAVLTALGMFALLASRIRRGWHRRRDARLRRQPSSGRMAGTSPPLARPDAFL